MWHCLSPLTTACGRAPAKHSRHVWQPLHTAQKHGHCQLPHSSLKYVLWVSEELHEQCMKEDSILRALRSCGSVSSMDTCSDHTVDHRHLKQWRTEPQIMQFCAMAKITNRTALAGWKSPTHTSELWRWISGRHSFRIAESNLTTHCLASNKRCTDTRALDDNEPTASAA